jgi:hypothetical protein
MRTIYPSEHEIKDTTESSTSASYLTILLKIDTGGKLTTQLYNKPDYFNFSIVNFSYLYSNIPSSPAYGVYISQLIRYARARSSYEQFLYWGRLLAHKLMLQGFLQSRLKSSFRKFYSCKREQFFLVICEHLKMCKRRRAQRMPDCGCKDRGMKDRTDIKSHDTV